MTKRPTWSTGLFMIIMLASILGTVYSSAAAANQCSSSTISTVSGTPVPLQAPLTVPANAAFQINLNQYTDLDGFTLAWGSDIDLRNVQVYYEQSPGNFNWSFLSVIGSNGKYKFPSRLNKVKHIWVQIEQTTQGSLLGVEVCPVVTNVNTLTPVDQVNPGVLTGLCDKALLEHTYVGNNEFGPQGLEQAAAGIQNNFSFKFPDEVPVTISGLEVEQSFNISVTSIVVLTSVSTIEVPEYTEVVGPNGKFKIIFDTPLNDPKIIQVNIANTPGGTTVFARPCEDWSKLRPTAAVALGDSFASGEGASYEDWTVPGSNGTTPGTYEDVFGWNSFTDATNWIYFNFASAAPSPQSFPGLQGGSKSAYFCHRSKNASLMKANLAVEDRFNLACGGGRPMDIIQGAYFRDTPPDNVGRAVYSQLTELEEVHETHDIETIQIQLGGNNSFFTYNTVLSKCVGNFMADAYFTGVGLGITKFFGFADDDVSQSPCTAESVGVSSSLLTSVSTEIEFVMAEIITKMESFYAARDDHDYNIVIQTYPNPLPATFHPEWDSADALIDESTENDPKFRKLARKRYLGGCLFHSASLTTAAGLAAGLNGAIDSAYNSLVNRFPNVDIRLSDVTEAFNGFRLCENATDADDWFTPLLFMTNSDRIQEKYPENIDDWNHTKLDEAGTICREDKHACQESMHPNKKGHRKIAECLTRTLAMQSNSNSKKFICPAGSPSGWAEPVL